MHKCPLACRIRTTLRPRDFKVKRKPSPASQARMNTTKNSHQEFRFTSEDGLQIACHRWQRGRRARGLFQIAHGVGEHSGRYAELTALLQEANQAVHPGVQNGFPIRWRGQSSSARSVGPQDWEHHEHLVGSRSLGLRIPQFERPGNSRRRPNVQHPRNRP
jgi:hypothetical protein